MKTVFIAHPISGDIQGNISKVLKICKEVHTKEIVPVVPYLISLQYLDDDIVEDRQLGIDANLECFHRGFIDELWLFGDCISSGMQEEVLLAVKLSIPIIPKTEETRKDFRRIFLKNR